MHFTINLAAFLFCLGQTRSKAEINKRGEPSRKYDPFQYDDPFKKQNLDLKMPGALPKMQDSYICSSFDISELSNSSVIHVTGFTAIADANKAHHMLLYSCNRPIRQPGVVYDCLHHSLCSDSSSIMFAWAKNAPPAYLPEGVSFEADTNKKKYFVLQVHYKHALPEPDFTTLSLTYQTAATKYQAGIFLLLTSNTLIPPNTPKTHGDANCELPSQTPLNMFAFRTHAHSLGSVITGYVYNENKFSYREIARGNPQWPQAFYPMKKVETVNPGEYVAARCTFNSTGVSKTTRIGSTAGDEMCNLYIMFYTEPGKASDYMGCVDEQAGSSITRGLPPDSDEPLPPNSSYENHAKNKNAGSVAQLNYNKLFTPDEDEEKLFKDELSNGSSVKKGGLDVTPMVASYNVTMPGVKPTRNDDYICTSYSVSELGDGKELWIKHFSALSSGNKAHHMILTRCKNPQKKEEGETWDCRHHSTCQGPSKIMFAWAKNAPATKLPDDVGFHLEPDDYLVLQVHYARPLSDPDSSGISLIFVDTEPKYRAGMYLLFRSSLLIPRNTSQVHGDVNCLADISSPIHVFAYRTHAHSLGTVISGYRYTPSIDHWTKLAKGNPQWPQAFYPMETVETINPGEILTARCTYSSVGVSKDTVIGSTAGDEMCNLYLMYYTLAEADDFKICADEADPGLTGKLPEGNDVPLPYNELLAEKAKQIHPLETSQPPLAMNTKEHDTTRSHEDETSKAVTEEHITTKGSRDDEPSNAVLKFVLLLTAFTLCCTCCIYFKKCRQTGKGTKGIHNMTKNWDIISDTLGRSKEGFQPLNTADDSEEEVFSVPHY